MRIEIHKSRIIPTIILSIAFVTKWMTYNVVWFFPYAVTFPLLVAYIISFINSWNDRDCVETKMIITFSLVPYVVSIVYSLIILFGKEVIINPILRAISLTAQYAYILLLVGVLYMHFKRNLADIVANALIVTYAYIIIAAFYGVGVSGVFSYITSFWKPERTIYILSRWFEIHDMGLSVGMLIIYNMFVRHDRRKAQTIFLFIIMIMCFKRITILAFALVAILAYAARQQNGMIKSRIINMSLIIMPFVCYIYIFLVSSGLLYSIADKYGVDFSGRQFLFVFMNRFYSFSPRFLGRGMGFTEKYLTSIIGTATGVRVSNYGYMHNDIVKMFIDYGFWGCMFWLIWLFWILSYLVGHVRGEFSKYVYCLILTYAFIIYMTDNATRYFVFQTVFFTVLLSSTDRTAFAQKKSNLIYGC